MVMLRNHFVVVFEFGSSSSVIDHSTQSPCMTALALYPLR